MSETELKKSHPYRSAQLQEERPAASIDGRVVAHVIAALGAVVSGLIARALDLELISFLLFSGACAVWILWAVPYAIYQVCRGRWRWRSTRRHVTASLVWMLAIGAVVSAGTHRVYAGGRAFDEVIQATAQATRRYQVDHGRYPETLSELVPRYLPREPFTGPPTTSHPICPIEYGVWQGVPTLWIPGRDPMFDSCIHRRGFGYDLRTGRELPR